MRTQTKSNLAKWIAGVSLGLAALSLLLFQNCAANPFGRPISLNLPSNHPSVEAQAEAALVTSKPVMGDGQYIRSVFEDVFLSPSSSADARNRVAAYLNAELLPTLHLWGRACDPMEMGSIDACYASVSNSQLAHDPSTSSGREAARLQTCRRLTSDSVTLNEVVQKVKGNETAPSATSASGIVRLFYPTWSEGEVSQVQTKLSELDLQMAKSAEKVEDRWRVMVLSVCESSGWELL